MRWAGHVARVEEGEECTRFWWGDLRESDHLEDVGVDGNMKIHVQPLGWRDKDWMLWLMTRAGGGLCECGNEHSDSIKCG
jgi:hypothetical protein